MKTLLVAATTLEVLPLTNRFKKDSIPLQKVIALDEGVDLIITGVGMVATAFTLGKIFSRKKYDRAINMGIAGSFDRKLNLGDVVQIAEDKFSELGAEDGEKFIPLDEMGLGVNCVLKPSFTLPHLKTVEGITVNTVHGNVASILTIQKNLNPQTESMEGAAFFYACKQFKIPCVQVRSLSNYVEPRDKKNWKIDNAIQNLNDYVINFLYKK